MGITIRRYEASDIDEMTAAVRESVREASRWMPWCHAGYARAEGEAWVSKTQAWHATGEAYEFAIIDETGRFAGSCGVNRINAMDGVANVGYWVRSSSAGRGVAPAAVRLLVPWAFANTPLNRLEIIAAIDNLRSQRVAEKVGAQRDAVLRKRTLLNGQPSDAVLYSLVRPD